MTCANKIRANQGIYAAVMHVKSHFLQGNMKVVQTLKFVHLPKGVTQTFLLFWTLWSIRRKRPRSKAGLPTPEVGQNMCETS